MSQATTRDRPGRAPAHDLATVERDLRATEGVHDVEVRVERSSGRLYWDTWEPNPALRGRTLAGVIVELGQSDYWQPVTAHDPMEREGGRISNAVTIRRVEDA